MALRLSITILGLFFCQQAIFTVAQDTRPLDIPEKAMAALLLSHETPPLSASPLKRCSNALVVVRVLVDAEGKVNKADFESGYSELKDSALAAVRRWTYRPYMVSGKPTPVRTQASILYLGDGQALPMHAPDGKGGTKGGNTLPLPAGCGPAIQIKKALN
ncbi:energy transducer TonB [Occallatibacter savannae]|uniref:energy transducer TonB n=1 Tax=Occallatibacter savannae TaxID=1002691 RepID=UPI0013A5AE9B|nr:energy transducer TonB [Occallatibacter savannae]